jgi:hypothetical protein
MLKPEIPTAKIHTEIVGTSLSYSQISEENVLALHYSMAKELNGKRTSILIKQAQCMLASSGI